MNWIDIELSMHDSLERIQRVREDTERLARSEVRNSRNKKVRSVWFLLGRRANRSKCRVSEPK